MHTVHQLNNYNTLHIISNFLLHVYLCFNHLKYKPVISFLKSVKKKKNVYHIHKNYPKNTQVRNFLSDLPTQCELYNNIVNLCQGFLLILI